VSERTVTLPCFGCPGYRRDWQGFRNVYRPTSTSAFGTKSAMRMECNVMAEAFLGKLF